MELINTTFLTAGINVGTPDPMKQEYRAALIVAKATFKEVNAGVFMPDTDAPHPLYPTDQETDFGVLPRDDFPKFDSGADVIVLGQAHAPGGKPCTSMTVSMQIGEATHYLKVFGNRIWEKSAQGLRISEAEPFLLMPMDYAHAYGGQAEYLQDDQFLTIFYPYNLTGKGFIREEDKAEGTPLPNIENPDALISNWEDQPIPASWATLPLNTPIHGQRGIDASGAELYIKPQFYCRANPELVLTRLNPEERIILHGMCPNTDFSFQIPNWKVSAFCQVGQQSQRKTASPDTLVILPEERRFYLVYRFWFDFLFKPEVRRAVRLEVEQDPISSNHEVDAV